MFASSNSWNRSRYRANREAPLPDPVEDFRLAILACLGVAGPTHIEPGVFHRFSTSGRPTDKAGWCQLFDDRRAGVFGDFRRAISSVWTASARELMTLAERTDMARQRAMAKAIREMQLRALHERNTRKNSALLANTSPVIDGDPVSLYLRQRGLIGPVPENIRLHPSLTYWDGGHRTGCYPAMIAPLVRSDGMVLALHRTYLTADGLKAPVPVVKKLTGSAGALAGACIPLHPPQDGVIGIAEGIETAQAAHLASGMSTVAAYCAGNLATYNWPVGVRRLVVFADSDLAGIRAAQLLKTRATRCGLSVAVIAPCEPGVDWCDVWARRPSACGLNLEIGA